MTVLWRITVAGNPVIETTSWHDDRDKAIQDAIDVSQCYVVQESELAIITVAKVELTTHDVYLALNHVDIFPQTLKIEWGWSKQPGTKAAVLKAMGTTSEIPTIAPDQGGLRDPLF